MSIRPRSSMSCFRRQPDPRVLRPVRQLALFGLALVLVWPAARGVNAWIGWLPLWLVGMPMVAWWALYGFAVPRWRRRPGQARRTPPVQARRRRPAAAAGRARAA